MYIFNLSFNFSASNPSIKTSATKHFKIKNHVSFLFSAFNLSGTGLYILIFSHTHTLGGFLCFLITLTFLQHTQTNTHTHTHTHAHAYTYTYAHRSSFLLSEDYIAVCRIKIPCLDRCLNQMSLALIGVSNSGRSYCVHPPTHAYHHTPTTTFISQPPDLDNLLVQKPLNAYVQWLGGLVRGCLCCKYELCFSASHRQRRTLDQTR